MVLEIIIFWNVKFQAVSFFGVLQFGLDLGRPGAVQKSMKNWKNCVRDAFGAQLEFSYDFRNGFEAILDGVWEEFARISDVFWLDCPKNF